MKTESISSVDWEKYLERKQPIIIPIVCLKTYGSMLKEVTDFGFDKQLQSYKVDTSVFYRSASEMKEADAHYLELVRNRDARLEEWRDLGVRYNREADELIARFVEQNDADPAEFTAVYALFETIFLYGTVIPYRILSALDSAPSETHEECMRIFEPLRAESKYPTMAAKVFNAYWRKAAQMEGSDDWEAYSFATPDELGAYFKGSSAIDKDEVRKRKEWCLLWEKDGSNEIVFNYDPEFAASLSLEKDTSHIKEIRGNVAFKGHVTGRARIVNTLADMEHFEAGEVIVSINTNPSLLQALAKCSAIVTDEGGIMCHAAIVSRELGKPCVIGTKIATSVIKNGDQVEVDAVSGVVRVIG